jgi:cell division protein FtsX
VLEKNPNLSIKTEASKELKSVNDLVGTQFVSVSRQYMKFVESEEQRNGHSSEESRLERLFVAFFNARAEVTTLAKQVEAMREQNRVLRRKYRSISK